MSEYFENTYTRAWIEQSHGCAWAVLTLMVEKDMHRLLADTLCLSWRRMVRFRVVGDTLIARYS